MTPNFARTSMILLVAFLGIAAIRPGRAQDIDGPRFCVARTITVSIHLEGIKIQAVVEINNQRRAVCN